MENEKQQSWKPLIAIALSMVMMYITTFGVNVLISAIVTDPVHFLEEARGC